MSTGWPSGSEMPNRAVVAARGLLVNGGHEVARGRKSHATDDANAAGRRARAVTGVELQRLRRCLGHFATGVTVVTTRQGDTVHGATVNAFTAVSLEPPLVLVSLDRRSTACGYLENAWFCVNVLNADQEDLAQHFAGRPVGLEEVSWVDPEGVPRLAGTLAHLVCSPWASYDGGDHVLHVGEVREFDVARGTPLIFYRGDLRELGDTLDQAAWMGSLDCPEGATMFTGLSGQR